MKFIHGHASKLNPPSWNGGKTMHAEGYVSIMQKGHPRAHNGYVFEHILVAEKAIGRYLPKTAEVHHVNEVRAENRNSNLVICESKGYHQLLHARTDGYRATGNPNARKCSFCHRFDVNLVKGTNRGSYHRSCAATYARGLRLRQRQAKEVAS